MPSARSARHKRHYAESRIMPSEWLLGMLILQMDLTGGNQPTTAKQWNKWETVSQPWQELLYQLTGRDLRTCPQCKIGTLVRRPLALYSVTEALIDSL